jgi:hypothetical protein
VNAAGRHAALGLPLVTVEEALTTLYRRLIDGWNCGDAGKMAAPIASDGLVIGFDGSQMLGP